MKVPFSEYEGYPVRRYRKWQLFFMSYLKYPIIKYALLTAVVLLVIGSVLLATDLIASYFNKTQWDSLAFTGALVGGAMTLLGVKITILNQSKSEFLDSFPLKIMDTDDIAEMLNNILESFEAYAKGETQKIENLSHEFQGMKDENGVEYTPPSQTEQ